MRVPDNHIEELRTRGFTVVEGFLGADELAAAREALWRLYPQPEAYHADPSAHPQFAESQFAGLRLFPYAEPALNRLAVHPDLVDLAERFLGTHDLDLYKIELWAKYSGATDYDQPHHRDYGNHSLVVPSLDGRHRQMTTFILLSDVSEDDGPTKLVPLEHTRDLPLVPRELETGAFADEEVSVTGPAGSLMVYRTDVLHRGSDLAGEHRARFSMLVDFQERGPAWQGKMSWPGRALEMGEALTAMSPRERSLFGWPPAGSPYWTEQTLRDTAARYPGMDMSPYGLDAVPAAPPAPPSAPASPKGTRVRAKTSA